jgi:two-component system alkaline phosphatase synthesis response regulator PhoP
MRTQRPKILVVDDDANACEALTDLLTGHGYNVITAGDGNEALKKAGTEKPNVVLMDIKLPGMDGYEACKRIKEDKALTTKVVLYTAYVDAVNVTKAREVGADDFQAKTSDFENLHKAIEVMLLEPLQ